MTSGPHDHRIHYYVPVGAVLDSVSADVDSLRRLLAEVSYADALLWAAKINLAITSPSSWSHRRQQQFGVAFFSSDEIDRINEYVRSRGGDLSKFSVFTRGQLLELMRWASLVCPETAPSGGEFGHIEMHRRFAWAALVASEIWHERITRDKFGVGGSVEERRASSLPAIRKMAEGALAAPPVGITLGRGWLLFSEFFPRVRPTFLEEFEARCKLTLRDYFVMLAATFSHFYHPEQGDVIFKTESVAAKTPHYDTFFRHLELLGQTPQELRAALRGHRDVGSEREVYELAPFDYRPLRNKPYLRLPDDRAVVLDPVFLADATFASPLFLLAAGQSERRARQLFTDFGDAFEIYACELLRTMYPSSEVLVDRLYVNVQDKIDGKDFQIDACLHEADHKELFVFEAKAVWLPESAVLHADHEKYAEKLREKYVEAGVAQLAKVAQLLTTTVSSSVRFPFLSEVEKIYPILLSHDRLLADPLHCHYLAGQFSQRVPHDAKGELGGLRVGTKTVYPLTVMTIQDLEDLETSVRDFRLRDALVEYSGKNPERLTDLRTHFYLTGVRLYDSEWVKARGVEVMEFTIEELFGGTGTPDDRR